MGIIYISTLLTDHLGYFGGICLWAMMLSSFSMFVYYYCSPQKALVKNSHQTKRIHGLVKKNFHKDRLILTLTFKLLQTTLHKVVLSIFPTLVSILPIIFMLGFLSTHFESMPLKAGEYVSLMASPSPSKLMINGQWIDKNANGRYEIKWPEQASFKIRGIDDNDEVTISTMSSHIYLAKKKWWNLLLPSSNGYLKPDTTFTMIYIESPQREYLPWGPDWLRSWIVVFMLSLILSSFGIKYIFNIE